MDYHLTDEQIGAFLAGSLTTQELLVVDDHFEVCEVCRNHTLENSMTPEVLHALSEQFFESPIEHPPHEQLQLYLDDKLDPVDREILYSHVSLCSECSDEVLELRQIKTALPEEKHAAIRPPQKLMPFLKKIFPTLRILGGFVAIGLALLVGSLFLKERLSGNTQLQSLGAENQEAVEAAGGAAIASIRDSIGTITVYKNGFVSGLNAFPPRYRSLSERALKAEQLTLPGWIRELKERKEGFEGAQPMIDSFELSEPVDVVVLSDSPRFEWKPLGARASYTIELFLTNFDSVAMSSAIRKTSWNYSGKLERGRIYLWRVTADKNGEKITSPQPPALPARFYVLDQRRLQQLEEIRNWNPNSHLLLGVAYAEAGLTKDAEKEFETLVKMNPESRTAMKLLESVRNL